MRVSSMDSDITDTGLAIGGLSILGLSLLCCVGVLLRTMCKDYKDKKHLLLNNGDDGISQV